MALALAHGAVCVGMTGQLVEVQVHLSSGLPSMTIVGLPDTSISESRDRVRSAIANSGFDWPRGASRWVCRRRSSTSGAPASTWRSRSPSSCVRT